MRYAPSRLSCEEEEGCQNAVKRRGALTVLDDAAMGHFKALLWLLLSSRAHSDTVTVSTVGELEAAVAGGAGERTVRLNVGTYMLTHVLYIGSRSGAKLRLEAVEAGVVVLDASAVSPNRTRAVYVSSAADDT